MMLLFCFVGINQCHIDRSNRKKSQEIHDCCFDYGKDIKVPYGSILPSVSVGRSVFAQQLTDTEHLLG